MTVGGWIFILLSWGVILSLLTYCYVRILSKDADNETDGSAELYPKVD